MSIYKGEVAIHTDGDLFCYKISLLLFYMIF